MGSSAAFDLGEELVGNLERALGLLRVLGQRHNDPEIEATVNALNGVCEALVVLVKRPGHLLVGPEHRDAAVELTTAYLDRTGRHQLLNASLTALDDRGRVDPEFRIGLLAALSQLVADALVAAVAARIDGDSELLEVDQAAVDEACRVLLARLVLATRD